jgi:hypothetical protein
MVGDVEILLSESSYDDHTTHIILLVSVRTYPDCRNCFKLFSAFLFSVRTREKKRVSNSQLVLILVLP